jgi:hypothetical protein
MALGVIVLLGLGGCVGADYYGGVSYRSHGVDPWYYDSYPYTGYYPYYSFPGYYDYYHYYPGQHHYPGPLYKRPYGRHDHHVIIDRFPGGRHDFKNDFRGDDYRHRPSGDRQWRGKDRWQNFHDHDKGFARPQRGLKCSGPRC